MAISPGRSERDETMFHDTTSDLQDQDQIFFFISDWCYPKTDGLRPHHWILLEQRMTEAMVTTGGIRHAKLQSNRHHQQTNTQFFTGRMPFLSPNQQCQSTEGNMML